MKSLSTVLVRGIGPLIGLVQIPSGGVTLLDSFRRGMREVAHTAVGRGIAGLSKIPS